ncbi:MAG TPA: hypothetical protein VF796_30400, partial [Humisphaera sp.]
PSGPAEGVAIQFEGQQAPAGYYGGPPAAPAYEQQPAAYEQPADEVVGYTPEPVNYAAAGGGYRPPARRREAYYEKLGFQQTIIPVLLVGALCMFALGASKWVVAKNAPLAALPVIFPIILFVCALGSAAVGVLAMFQVKSKLEREAREKAGQPKQY